MAGVGMSVGGIFLVNDLYVRAQPIETGATTGQVALGMEENKLNKS